MDTQAAIYHYCNYSERCHKDVCNKLYELGCTTPEVEQNIATVIENGLLNEERYAKAFARGKFNTLRWGRVKIVHQLKAHGISPYCIKKALQEIDEDDYAMILQKLAVTKLRLLYTTKHKTAKKAKLYSYLVQKGYERELVIEITNKLLEVKLRVIHLI